MDKLESMLRELTEANGVSGYEADVRAVMKKYFSKLGDISYDNLGSIICAMPGGSKHPRVLLAAHMDEIGFMVKTITKEGFIRFTTLGGWPTQVLPAQRVIIQSAKGDITGIINCKPPFFMSDEERKKTVDKKGLYIDIGATCEEEVAKAGVRIGDPVVPVSPFAILNVSQKTYMAKAFDDRAGNALSIAVMEALVTEEHSNTVIGAATVQEEVGVRGATTSVESINPDVAIILEVDIAGDTPEVKPEDSANKFGAGPCVLAYDSRMIPNLKLRDMVIETAEENDIPIQLSSIEVGATDGSVIHLHKTGVPTIVLSVPTRHIHSHNSIMRRDDFEATLKLATEVVRKLDSETTKKLCQW